MSGIMLAAGTKKMAGGGGGNSLLTDLISFWPLDEASGNAADSHGTNTLVETSGTIGAATGLVYGTARDFEVGDTEYFTLADNASISVGDIDFTFAAWVKLESKPGTSMRIAMQFDYGANQRSWLIGHDNVADRFQFAVSSNGTGGANTTTLAASSLGAPSLATWYLIIGWHDAAANTINIQVNNGTADSAAWSAGVHNSTAAFTMGTILVSGVTDGTYYDGLIGPAMFWKRVLTAGERTDIYNAGAGRAYSYFE